MAGLGFSGEEEDESWLHPKKPKKLSHRLKNKPPFIGVEAVLTRGRLVFLSFQAFGTAKDYDTDKCGVAITDKENQEIIAIMPIPEPGCRAEMMENWKRGIPDYEENRLLAIASRMGFGFDMTR